MDELANKFSVIYADPPWEYVRPSGNRGEPSRHYSTMVLDDIKALPVREIANKDCVLFMWATFPKLAEGLSVIDAWGFTYKTCAFVWVKTNRRTNPDQPRFFPVDSFDSFWGMGRWTRSNAEICLLGTKGTPQRYSAGVHQLVYSPIDKHSRKPPEVRNLIVDLCGDVPRIELFARQKVEGWRGWGEQMIQTDINLVNADADGLHDSDFA